MNKDRMVDGRIARERTVSAAGHLLLAFLLLGASSLLPSPPPETKKIQVRLEEVLTIGTLEDDSLLMWACVAPDAQGHLYVTDTMDYSLKKFDARGRLLKKTGRKGKGPGEFLAPRDVVLCGQRLYVMDQYSLGLQVFDTELSFQKEFPLAFPLSRLKVHSSGALAMAVLDLKDSRKNRIVVMDGRGKTIREYPYTREKAPSMMERVEFIFSPAGDLYLAYNFRDCIEKLGPQGKKEWSRRILGFRDAKSEKIHSMILPTEFIYKDIALDSANRIYVLGGSLSKNPSRDVYVLDAKGAYLTTFTLPDTSHCIVIDNQDHLYSRANDGVTLKKFKIHVREENRKAG